MSDEFEIFKGKTLSSLFQDIYTNQLHKKSKISDLITELKKMVRHTGDVAVVGPIIKDLIETSVKNDDQLVKLAQIAQRIMTHDKKGDTVDGFLSAEEKAQLLKDIDSIQIEVSKVDEITVDVDDIRKKIK